MTKPLRLYLAEKSADSALPIERTYDAPHGVAIGRPLALIDADSGEGYLTSTVVHKWETVTALTVTTRNTVYYFSKEDVG